MSNERPAKDEGIVSAEGAIEIFPEERGLTAEIDRIVDTRETYVTVAEPDLDIFDRARADDSPIAGSYFASARHRGRGSDLHRVALIVVALVAAVGWGAFVYEKTRPGVRGRNVETTRFPAAVTSGANNNQGQSLSPGGQSLSPLVAAPVGRSAVPAAASLRPSRPSLAVAETSSTNAALSDATTRDVAADLSGPWVLATESDPSSLSSQRRYYLDLRQRGRQLSGVVRKVSENDEIVDQAAQAAMPIEGTFDGRRLMVTFVEASSRRGPPSKFVLQREDDGVLRGRFTLEGTTGTVEGRRY